LVVATLLDVILKVSANMFPSFPFLFSLPLPEHAFSRKLKQLWQTLGEWDADADAPWGALKTREWKAGDGNIGREPRG